MAATNHRLVNVLVAASVLWPLLLATAAWPDASGRVPAWSPVVYLAASRVCHQKPERSFHTAGLQWPVCARCAGLYLAAPLGAVAASLVSNRRRLSRSTVTWLVVASLPTAVTLGLEWLTSVPVGNLARTFAALPLGAAVAFAVVGAAGEPRGPIGYTQRP